MKLIVEGIKCSGKSTLLRKLDEAVPGANVIQFRSYFDLHNGGLNIGRKYIDRMQSLTKFLQHMPHEDIFLLRGHLFPIYCHWCVKTRNWMLCKNTVRFDEILSSLDFKLIILHIDEIEYKDRINEREAFGRAPKPHDLLTDSVMRHQEKLLEISDRSKLERITIDTSRYSKEDCLKIALGA